MEIILPASVSRFQVDGLVNGKDSVQSLLYAVNEEDATKQYVNKWSAKYTGIKVMSITKVD